MRIDRSIFVPFFNRQQQQQQQERRAGPGNNANNVDRPNNNRPNDRNRDRNAGGASDRDNDRANDRSNDRDRMRKNNIDRLRKSDDFLIGQRLKNLQGPLIELPPIEEQEQKFSGRNRLYVGNLPNDTTDAELIEIFKPYGEIAESFLNTEKNFAFLKVDYRSNAERAKRELDGSVRKNRSLRVRFAPNATTLKVFNLTPYISNELLYKAFEIFGNVSFYFLLHIYC